MAKQRRNKKRSNNEFKFVAPKTMRPGGWLEYKMPEAMYDDLAAECMKKRAGDVHEYVCDYVNEEYGLLGTCVRVIRG